MADVYVDSNGLNKFKHMFKKVYSSLPEAAKHLVSGDTLHISVHSLNCPENTLIIPDGIDLVIEGNGVTLMGAREYKVMGLPKSGHVVIKDMNIILGEQAQGIVLGANSTADIELDNVKIYHAKHKVMDDRCCWSGLLGAHSFGQGSRLVLRNCEIDQMSYCAETVEVYESIIGSPNEKASGIGASNLVIQDSSLNNLALYNYTAKRPAELRFDKLGVGIKVMGDFSFINDTFAYDDTMDKQFRKSQLKMTCGNFFNLVDAQGIPVLTIEDTQGQKNGFRTNVRIHRCDFDTDSYQNFAQPRKAEYSWFKLVGDGNVEFNDLTIPKAPMPSLASGTVMLDNMNDSSDWVQNDVKVRNRGSKSRLIDASQDRDELSANTKSAMQQLQDMIGLAPVKTKIQSFINTEIVNAKRRNAGLHTEASQGRNLVFIGNAGTGKAVSDDTKIPTPSGFKRADEIKLGESIFTKNGQLTKVVGVYPKGQCNALELRLRDGRTVQFNQEHIWEVITPDGEIKDVTFNGDEEVYDENGYKYRLPQNGCVAYDEKEVAYHPYLLGAFMSASSLSAGAACLNLSVRHQEWLTKVTKLLEKQFKTNIHAYRAFKRNYNYHFKCDVCPIEKSVDNSNHARKRYLLRNADVFGDDFAYLAEDHFIPMEYQANSEDVRWQVLQGIFDGKGVIDGREILLRTVSEHFADDVCSMLRSLGLSARKVAKGKHFEVFVYGKRNLKRKLFTIKEQLDQFDKLIQDDGNDMCEIVELRQLHQTMSMRCFKVDDPSHLFLCGDYVVTHNTTVARLLGDILFENGVIKNPKVEPVKASKLIGKYVGHTAPAVEKMVKSHLGGLLFIDEAYALCPPEQGTSFNTDAIDELVGQLGVEEIQKNLIVILAGYPQDIKRMFSMSNQGLRSRFPNFIDFPDYTPEEMVKILAMILKKNQYMPADGAAGRALRDSTIAIAKQQNSVKGGGNGRLMRDYFDVLREAQSNRIVSQGSNVSGAELMQITKEDVARAQHQMEVQFNASR